MLIILVLVYIIEEQNDKQGVSNVHETEVVQQKQEGEAGTLERADHRMG